MKFQTLFIVFLLTLMRNSCAPEPPITAALQKENGSVELLEPPVFEMEVYFFDASGLLSFDPTYTSIVYVADHMHGKLSGPFRGSSFPNSLPAQPDATPYNTIVDKEHIFNNRSGHKAGNIRGLNIVDRPGRGKWEGRFNPGLNPEGNPVIMQDVNVHSGFSARMNYNSRGSHGCLTIHPEDAKQFFECFDYTGQFDTTGNVEGGLYLFRENIEVTELIIRELKSEYDE